jgi:hypothetical protein
VKIQVQVSLEYGILFLYDPYNEPEIPLDTGAAPITHTDTCVCFQVRAYVDGDAEVTISDQPLSSLLVPTFVGQISAPSQCISLVDVSTNYYCLLKLVNIFAKVKIWSVIDQGIEKSWIQISNLDLF